VCFDSCITFGPSLSIFLLPRFPPTDGYPSRSLGHVWVIAIFISLWGSFPSIRSLPTEVALGHSFFRFLASFLIPVMDILSYDWVLFPPPPLVVDLYHPLSLSNPLTFFFHSVTSDPLVSNRRCLPSPFFFAIRNPFSFLEPPQVPLFPPF